MTGYKTFEKNRAETLFLHVFRLHNIKRAETHAKRSIFTRIQDVMPNDSLLCRDVQTHWKIMKYTTHQTKKLGKLVISLFFNLFQNACNSWKLLQKTLFLHVFRHYSITWGFLINACRKPWRSYNFQWKYLFFTFFLFQHHICKAQQNCQKTTENMW